MEKLEERKNGFVGCSVLLLLGIVLVVAVGAEYYYAAGYMNKKGLSKGTLSREETIELFDNAEEFNFRCSKKTLRDRTYIAVNGTYYGTRVDNFSIFNSKTFFYTTNKEELFHIEFTNHWKPANADKELITATTYAIFSPEYEIIGHLQETLIDKEGFEKDYYYVWYDKNGNDQGYYIKDGKIFDRNGNVIVTSKLNNFGIFKRGIEIFKKEGAVIPYEDIFFLYMIRYSEWCRGIYSY